MRLQLPHLSAPEFTPPSPSETCGGLGVSGEGGTSGQGTTRPQRHGPQEFEWAGGCRLKTWVIPGASPPPLPTEPLPFRTTRVEHDGAQWVWWWTEASGKARPQSSTVGVRRRFKGHILYPL